MQRFILTLLVVCSFTFTINGLAQGEESISYFPQHIGDEHVYRKSGRTVGENDLWTDKITQQIKKFFVHSNYWGNGVTHLLKVNRKMNVVERKDDQVATWYMFTNGVGKAWTMKLLGEGPPCVDNAEVKIISTQEEVSVPAGRFEKCLKLTFTSSCNDAGIAEQWFAPGVGLVKQTEITIAGPLTSELVRAKVGDETYPKQ